MNDDTIAFAYDGDGKKHEMDLVDVYANIFEMSKIAYFDFMIRCIDGNYKDFKEAYLATMEKIVDSIHDTYLDHIEGARRGIGNTPLEPDEEYDG